jgi:hypothetical protein
VPLYVPYDDSVEVRQPNEEATIRQVGESFARLRALSFDKHQHGLRGAHAKSHGILQGELVVDRDLDPALAQGMFRVPARYPVIVRLSTTPGDLLPDGVASFRGMAIKVIGVEGQKLLPDGRDAVTQDFLFINHPTFATGDVAAYLKAQLRMEKLAHVPEEVQEGLTTITRVGGTLLRHLGIDATGLIGQGMPHTHILGDTFFSAAAIRYGDYIAKLSVVPVSASLQRFRDATVDASNDMVLRQEVVNFFRENDAEYELRVQLCTNLERMPVEDASVRWSEEESPYLPVGRLRLPAQEAYSAARRVYADDVLAFSPWHCMVEHRPLGSIMRVRRPVYDESSIDRHARNARTRREPRDIGEMPE